LSHELEEQRAHLSELFAPVPEAIVMVDRDSRITRVNPAFTTIFGFTAGEAIDRRIIVSSRQSVFRRRSTACCIGWFMPTAYSASRP